MSFRLARLFFLFLILILAHRAALASPAAPQAAAAQPTPGPGEAIEWHTVAPGDTLEGLTEKNLGTWRRWQENWRLNPDLKDPHRLDVGTKIRVLVRRKTARGAELKVVERRVESKPHPNEWRPARVGDRLKERDGVQTYTRSSAELSFDDGARFVLTENSLVFLRETVSAQTGPSRDSVEIVEGQADVQHRPPAAGPRAFDIEVVLGNSKARPRADEKGPALARARLPKAGEAQVMIYGGESDVEAGGKTVNVPRGMGTSVPRDGVPRPPERLLPAPRLDTPTRASRWSYANPRLTWTEVPGAAAYVVEVCRDPGCAALVDRTSGVIVTNHIPEVALPVGDVYWRVTAVAKSGLDGYPSAATLFTIANDRLDVEPPAIAIAVDGPGSITGAESVVLLPQCQLLLDAYDDASGVMSVQYRWDSGPWQTHNGAVARPPMDVSQKHVLEYQATDRLGRTSKVQRLEVEFRTGEEAPTK